MDSLQKLMSEQPHVSAGFRGAFAEANEKAAADLGAINAVAERHRDLRDAIAPDTHPNARLAYEQIAAETALQTAIRNAGLDMAALPKSKREQILKAMRGLYWSAVSEGLSVREQIDNG